MGAAEPVQQWHNALPRWIVSSEDWRRTSKSARLILQTIADRCDPPAVDGSLAGAFGSGQAIAQAAGVHCATYWRCVTRLERLGFLVPVGRGGRLRLRGRRGDHLRTIANSWAIPGSPGALDTLRVDREVARMAVDVDGRLVRQLLRPGDQPALFPGIDHRNQVGGEPRTVTHNSVTHTHTAGVCHSDPGHLEQPRHRNQAGEKCECPTRKMRVGYSQDATPPTHRPAHGGGCGVYDNTSRGVVSHFRVMREELERPELFERLLERCERHGFVRLDREADVVWLWAARAHALAVGHNPPALFAAMLRRDLRTVITAADETAGGQARWMCA